MEDLKNYLNEIRREFSDQELDEKAVHENPFEQYAKWFEEAVGSQLLDPYAMSLSTVNSDGQPSTRIVYLRDIIDEGFVFYTNYNSQKAQDLEQNSKAALNFLYRELDRQIRVEGIVKRVSTEISDAYFAKRPRESQIGAWASDQSAVLKDRNELESKVEHFKKKFEGSEVSRPPHWGGFVLSPSKIEFWQGRPSRLHDRIVYMKNGSDWKIKRLSP